MAGAKGLMREAPVFDGNDRLTLPALTNFSNDVGMALWVKPTKATGEKQYLLGDPTLDDEFKLWIDEDSPSLYFSVSLKKRQW